MTTTHGPATIDVLIVEDHPVVRSVMSSVLTRAGYTCAQAENGADALAAVDQSRYRAIVLDVHMPVLDGLQFYEELRKRRPDLAARTVFVTAIADSPPVSAFFANFQCHVIEKPYELKTLLNAVSELVGRPPAPEMLI